MSVKKICLMAKFVKMLRVQPMILLKEDYMSRGNQSLLVSAQQIRKEPEVEPGRGEGRTQIYPSSFEVTLKTILDSQQHNKIA